MKQFKAASAKDHDLRTAVQDAIKHHTATGEQCQAVAFSVLLWDSRRQ